MHALLEKYGLEESDVQKLMDKIDCIKKPNTEASPVKNHSPIQVWDRLYSTISDLKKRKKFLQKMEQADRLFNN